MPNKVRNANRYPITGISVYAEVIGGSGPFRYYGVDIRTGLVLFDGCYSRGSSAIANFIGLAHAVMYSTDHKLMVPIFSDNKKAVSWVDKKDVPDGVVHDNRLQLSIINASIYLNECRWSYSVNTWKTHKHGPIPNPQTRYRK